MRQRQALVFLSPGQVEVQTEPLPEPAPGQALVKTLLSAISSGTESLVFRGQFPTDVEVDDHLPALRGAFAYPLKYGYGAVGRVVALGLGVDPAWQDRLVFAFQPHQTAFLADPVELQLVPEGLLPEEAVFLPNMETALNLVMDGRPVLGERVLVLGQGIIGLLTTALLALHPLEKLVTLDRFALRREASLRMGAHASFDPAEPASQGGLERLLGQDSPGASGGADLTFEISGSPEALNQAIALTGFDGRVVIGSWYGRKHLSLDLGGRFHRSRIRLLSSQVSTIASDLSGRWDKARRFALAWEMLRRLRPSRLVTQRFPLRQAAEAYRLIDEQPEQTIQVLLTYET